VVFGVATFINRISLERISDFIRVIKSLRQQRIAAFRQYEIRVSRVDIYLRFSVRRTAAPSQSAELPSKSRLVGALKSLLLGIFCLNEHLHFAIKTTFRSSYLE
jgi:hypothetical protein